MPQTPPIKPPRDHAPINLWNPNINTTPITSIPHLHQLLQTDYPGLQSNPNYTTWLHDAETHLTLIHHLKGKTHLQRGDRKHLGKALGITRQKFTAWAQDARKPRLYYEIERSISKINAELALKQIYEENNEINSTEDVLHRLDTYYLTPLHSQSSAHEKRLEQCDIYFSALKALKEGGQSQDIGRMVGTDHSCIQRWFEGQRPDYINLVRHIPKSPPQEGNKWLPLNIDQAFHPSQFIEVPENITHWTQISSFLDQVSPLENNSMKNWQNLFGPQDKQDAFFYLLGLIVSDFDKQSSRISSTELVLNLSKNYEWSKQLGEAACYYIGQIGIQAQKVKDRDSSAGPETCHSWRSQKSPLITWILQSALGLKSDERTTYHPIKANWILEAPRNLRIAFFQGLNDGDGWSSVKDQCFGNACKPNIEFVKKLLLTFGIDSTDDKQRVRVRSQKGLITIAELPAFRHAYARLQNATKIAEMMRVRQKQKSDTFSPELIDEIMKLHREGYSNGSIAEIIFDKHQISLGRRTVARRIQARERESI
jgi:hypothetical protein